ncbi:hypothetical protein EVAR_35390_1 [Eumeta japonica]|uniref:Uncharacterized protein n=1 Tax=Eumeta variegata TaxID=151549 RepID=A0A4C1XD14_EUMVA|nr:hypothetical protein EVAR_35390_1 [Eumeta japonica]
MVAIRDAGLKRLEDLSFPCSLDLALSDFYPFLRLKKYLKGQRFEDELLIARKNTYSSALTRLQSEPAYNIYEDLKTELSGEFSDIAYAKEVHKVSLQEKETEK